MYLHLILVTVYSSEQLNQFQQDLVGFTSLLFFSFLLSAAGWSPGKEEEEDWPCQAKDAVQSSLCQRCGHIWTQTWTQLQCSLNNSSKLSIFSHRNLHGQYHVVLHVLGFVMMEFINTNGSLFIRRERIAQYFVHGRPVGAMHAQRPAYYTMYVYIPCRAAPYYVEVSTILYY